ncbi:MAG: ABC transporter ATP-binding protein [Candidatus Carbobacillus altaicus]|nr:ABC transporter ATP-binding protein [Candidatus Carbobacillus altaicus]
MIIRLRAVSHAYITEKGAHQALRDIELTARKGEFVTLVGTSGGGKSTILSLIAGLLKPTRGTIEIGKASGDRRAAIGYMLQHDYLLPWRTILKNVLYGLEIQKKICPEDIGRAHALLDEVGLSGYARRYPHELSGGQRQRVSLVRTLITDPDILLLDEPFSALDYTTRLKLEDLLFDLLHRYQKTVLLVTHDISEAIALSDRIYVLGGKPGRIVKEIHVPESMHPISPLSRRRMPAFQSIFQEIWEVMERHAATDTEHAADGT